MFTFLYAGPEDEGQNAWDEGVIIALDRNVHFITMKGVPRPSSAGVGIFLSDFCGTEAPLCVGFGVTP